jgi:hypothetical protein
MDRDDYKKAMLGTEEEIPEPEEKTPDTETETTEEVTEETQETPTETPVDTETETEEQVDPLVSLMQETGLNNTYGTPEAALRGVAEKNRFIEEQREENRKLHDLLKQQLDRQVQSPQSAQTSEEFVEQFSQDPEGTLRAAGFVHQSQMAGVRGAVESLRTQRHNEAIATAVSKREDIAEVAPYLSRGEAPPQGLNPTWDRMWALYSVQGVNAASPETTIDMLHKLAQPTAASKPKVPPVPANKKVEATTTSGGRKTTIPSGDVPDWNKMSAAEIEAFFEKHGLTS